MEWPKGLDATKCVVAWRYYTMLSLCKDDKQQFKRLLSPASLTEQLNLARKPISISAVAEVYRAAVAYKKAQKRSFYCV
jgi:hypothetical protein